jgi:hypothetical protein
MRGSKANLPAEGPLPDDCGRLVAHLRNEYMPDLRIEVNFYNLGAAVWSMKMEVLNDSLVTLNGEETVNVWAVKTFGIRINSISTNDLYDLLMTAYRSVDRFMRDGEAFAPARRVK